MLRDCFILVTAIKYYLIYMKRNNTDSIAAVCFALMFMWMEIIDENSIAFQGKVRTLQKNPITQKHSFKFFIKRYAVA